MQRGNHKLFHYTIRVSDLFFVKLQNHPVVRAVPTARDGEKVVLWRCAVWARGAT